MVKYLAKLALLIKMGYITSILKNERMDIDWSVELLFQIV